jgi:hypothetical protein
MMQVDDVKRGTFDRQIPIAVRSSWRGAMECNGNGLCFNFDAKSPMCPSMKITRTYSLAERARHAGARVAASAGRSRSSTRSSWKKSCRKNAPACAR